MSMPFYSSLNENDLEIRILDILPCQHASSPVECAFRTTSLLKTPAPRYTALSYTWGPRHPASDLIVDGNPCSVTLNLASALRHLRHQKEKVSVWADAVCINQKDDKEKTAQLFILEDIYRDAERTLAWLGDESADSSLAMEMIQRWASGNVQYNINAESGSDLLVGSNQDVAFGEAATAAINNLLQRPYWTRVWIQQEVALAKTVIVQCGRASLPFGVFTRATSEWAKLRDSTTMTNDFIQNMKKLAIPSRENERHLQSLIELRQQQQKLISSPGQKSSNGTSLFDFLRSYEHLQSTDPRDRIYALLGLNSPMSRYRSQIQPSYKKTSHQVFCDVARVLIADDRSLKAAVFARNLTSRSPVKSLPSWVPDWTGTEVLYPLHVSGARKCDEVGKGLDTSAYVQISADGHTLSVKGALCDRVAAVHADWGKIYQKNPAELPQWIQGRVLRSGYTVIESIFHLLSGNLESGMSGLSYEQVEARMAQAAEFLRFLVDSSLPDSEIKEAVINLSRDIFGGRNSEFLETINRYFPSTVDGSTETKLENDRTRRQRAISTIFSLQALGIVRQRAFFETQNGTLGIGHQSVQVGDVIVQTPLHPGYLLLLPFGKQYVLRGECSIFAHRPARNDPNVELQFINII